MVEQSVKPDTSTTISEEQSGTSDTSTSDKIVTHPNSVVKRENEKTLNSDRDSLGNELSAEQQDYFKSSKVRDEGGNLIVVYHGTRKADFTKFNRNYNFFTDSAEMADSYSPNGEKYTGYLNIKKPYSIDAKGEKWSRIPIDAETKALLDKYGSSTFKENGKWRTTPADLAAAIEEGIEEGEFDYDGIIIKNLDDTGSYAKVNQKIIANDYITFNSNQFKNVDNKNPTSDPDIRYSDREIQPITEEEYQTLEKHFGVTGNFRVAGYLLPNGKLLDFSGKHWGDTTSRSRQVDHRDVNEVLDRGNNGFSSMVDMIGSGNIRLMPETGGINLAVYPNEKQRRVLSIYIKQMLATEGQVIVDYDTVGGDTVYSRVYEKYASSEQILRDIRNYFNGARQSDLMQFHTMYSDRRSDVSELQEELEKLNIEFRDVLTLADGYFKNYGGALNRSEIRYDFLRAIKIMSEATGDSYEQAFEEIVRIADELSNNPKIPDNVLGDLKEMKNHIRGIKFRVHDIDKPEFDRYGGFGEFRKRHMGKLTLANDGISVDSVYKELQGLYGTSWFPEVNTVSEQLMKLADVVDTDPASVLELDYDPKEVSRQTVDDIVQRMGDIISASWNRKQDNKAKKEPYINVRGNDTISNRTLLANALDSVAKNDIEKNRLNQYKNKIALIESEQAKLTEIRAELRELYFTKGRRDTDKIKSLQESATQIENRINTYDRQLLKLESTEALKGVLDREKKMAYKQAEQRGKESLRRQKEKDAATVRELMTRNYESRKKATESRNKTAMREKIRKVVNDLNKLLLNPTQDKHVPIGLQKVVAEALDVINMDTMNAEERVAYYNDLISKSNNPDEIAMLKKKRDFFEYRDMNFKDRITSLKSAYAEFKESDDSLIRNAHNDAIEDLIKNTADEVGNKSLKDMSLTQLEKVYDMYKAILATVRNTNKMFKEGRQETVTENSNAVKLEVREVGGHKDRVLKMTKFLKKFGWEMLKPVTAMKVIGSKTFERLFNNVRAAEDTWAVDVNEAKQFYEDIAAKYGYNKWDLKKFYSLKDGAGADISMTLEQIMSLYAYSKREQADKHFEFGGFIFDDSIEVIEIVEE